MNKGQTGITANITGTGVSTGNVIISEPSLGVDIGFSGQVSAGNVSIGTRLNLNFAPASLDLGIPFFGGGSSGDNNKSSGDKHGSDNKDGSGNKHGSDNKNSDTGCDEHGSDNKNGGSNESAGSNDGNFCRHRPRGNFDVFIFRSGCSRKDFD